MEPKSLLQFFPTKVLDKMDNLIDQMDRKYRRKTINFTGCLWTLWKGA